MESTDKTQANNSNKDQDKKKSNEILAVIGLNKYIRSATTGTIYKQYNNESYYRDYYHKKTKGCKVMCDHCGKSVYQNYLEQHKKNKYCMNFNDEKKALMQKILITCDVCNSQVNSACLKRHKRSKKCLAHLC